MKEAYETTIEDFEIVLRHIDWWRFKRIYWLNKQIDYYEGLLDEENDKKRRNISE